MNTRFCFLRFSPNCSDALYSQYAGEFLCIGPYHRMVGTSFDKKLAPQTFYYKDAKFWVDTFPDCQFEIVEFNVNIKQPA